MKQTITIDKEPYEIDQTVAGAIDEMQSEIEALRNALVRLAVFVGGDPCWCRCEGGKHSKVCRDILKLKLWPRVTATNAPVSYRNNLRWRCEGEPMTRQSETQERLKQIRERQSERAQWRYGQDIDFLLSLIDTRAPVDSQGAGGANYEWLAHEILSEYNSADDPGLLREKVAEGFASTASDAATQMRDAWVERVESMADAWLKNAIEDKDPERSNSLHLSYNVAQTIITELQSVALGPQERTAQAVAVDQCLREVKRMRINWEDGMRWPHDGDLFDEIESRLESLTLDQVKQEKE